MQPSSPDKTPKRYPGLPRSRGGRPRGAAVAGQGRARAVPDTPQRREDEDLSHEHLRRHHPGTDPLQTGPGPSGRPPLRRAYDGRMLAGVCPGLADYLAIDVTIVRVAFAVFTFLGGAAIPAYLACLLLIPEEGSDQSLASSLLDSVR